MTSHSEGLKSQTVVETPKVNDLILEQIVKLGIINDRCRENYTANPEQFIKCIEETQMDYLQNIRPYLIMFKDEFPAVKKQLDERDKLYSLYLTSKVIG